MSNTEPRDGKCETQGQCLQGSTIKLPLSCLSEVSPCPQWVLRTSWGSLVLAQQTSLQPVRSMG